jgi:hypothetical protein
VRPCGLVLVLASETLIVMPESITYRMRPRVVLAWVQKS